MLLTAVLLLRRPSTSLHSTLLTSSCHLSSRHLAVCTPTSFDWSTSWPSESTMCHRTRQHGLRRHSQPTGCNDFPSACGARMPARLRQLSRRPRPATALVLWPASTWCLINSLNNNNSNTLLISTTDRPKQFQSPQRASSLSPQQHLHHHH